MKESKIGNLLRTYTILYLTLTPKHLKEKSSKKSYFRSKVLAKNLWAVFKEFTKFMTFRSYLVEHFFVCHFRCKFKNINH